MNLLEKDGDTLNEMNAKPVQSWCIYVTREDGRVSLVTVNILKIGNSLVAATVSQCSGTGYYLYVYMVTISLQ